MSVQRSHQSRNDILRASRMGEPYTTGYKGLVARILAKICFVSHELRLSGSGHFIAVVSAIISVLGVDFGAS